jgi:4-hydroxybenzoate polyprenyltransferase
MIQDFLTELRPRQWTKNLVAFAALIFSQNLDHPSMVFQALMGFVSLCLLSGSIYVLNDLADLEKDRANPLKRHRPLASGRLGSRPAAVGVSIVLALGLAVAAATGARFLLTAVVFILLNLAYTHSLKNVVILDVLVIALSFILRAIAGVEALVPLDSSIELSPWLLVCTLFLSLFLGFSKRLHELEQVDERKGRRAVLLQYTRPLLHQLVGITAGSSVIAYSIYTIWPGTLEKFHTQALLYTVPIVAFGVMRYLYLVYARQEGGDPSEHLLSDRGILGSVLAWTLCVVAIFYWGR